MLLLINFIKDVWKESDFSNPKNPTYTKKIKNELIYDGPILLPYKSEKSLGFYLSNVDVIWYENNTKLRAILDIGEYKVTQDDSDHASVSKKLLYYTYHPFQPIGIKNIAKQKTNLKLDTIIPAFYLKAVEEKKTTANIYTSIEYAVDILSAFSGAGYLLKFRNITKLTKLGKAINFARKGAAAIEITSGTTNVILKITGIADTELGNALSEYLFYLEMLSLSVDVTEWISKGLKKSAKNVLKHKALKKHLDDLVEKGELNEIGKVKVLDKLEELGDFAKFSKNIDSVKLTKADLKLWKYIIKTKGGRLRFISESDEILKLHKTHKFDAMFRATDIPPTIWIKNPPTDLELFHETMHFEDYLKRGKENYLKGTKRKLKSGKIIIPTKRDELIASYLREKYVLDKVLEEQANWIKKYGKGRFSEEEILDSKIYFNEYEKSLIIEGIDINNIKLKE